MRASHPPRSTSSVRRRRHASTPQSKSRSPHATSSADSLFPQSHMIFASDQNLVEKNGNRSDRTSGAEYRTPAPRRSVTFLASIGGSSMPRRLCSLATPVSLFVYGLLKIRLSTAHTARRRQRSTSGPAAGDAIALLLILYSAGRARTRSRKNEWDRLAVAKKRLSGGNPSTMLEGCRSAFIYCGTGHPNFQKVNEPGFPRRQIYARHSSSVHRSRSSVAFASELGRRDSPPVEK